MRKVVKTLKYFLIFTAIYVFVFIYIAGFIYANDIIEVWKGSEAVIIHPEKIEIEGLGRLNRDAVLLLTGLNESVSWFDVDERSLEKYLYSTGWVKRCTVKKMFPDAVRIVIEEFVPAVVVSNVRQNKEEDAVYTMWFADEEGVVFKKTFPGEIDDDIPFFHIDNNAVGDGWERGKKIREAVTISDSWRNAGDLCSIRSMRYDRSGHYTLDCETDDKKVTVIHLGRFEGEDEVINMAVRFFDTAGKLTQKNIWAGEYIFEGKGKNKRIIVGKVTEKIKRGSDA